MPEKFYIISLEDGEVMQTTDRTLALQYAESEYIVVINTTTDKILLSDNELEIPSQ